MSARSGHLQIRNGAPGRVWVALWRDGDGRHKKTLVARSPRVLEEVEMRLGRLGQAARQDGQGGAQVARGGRPEA
jgi:hypothetical protein